MNNYFTQLSFYFINTFVITVSRHDLDDHKHKNGVATDLFCTGVIGHPGSMFFKLGIEILNLKQYD